ncbi:hypothetical protein T552_02784 [Pneumocystis carinii B80]|uniref:STI1 domain-containing protein n=1 Tax=Pneumocystis carinii (strain B80) TaxID=1408658 RepID=A0A0W4ZEH5_PNEC8|nr:hypothetical protein T552_02784 [Pneumocystis carinii B80]KTW26783.1 hypothetical protein T552_02784 [Pneumocystis carinii B80]
MVDTIREKANALFSKKEYNEAIKLYTEAIVIEPKNHLLYSNRSACYASLKDFDKALEDAVKCIEIKPEWAKGWSRKGAALHGKGEYEEAKTAYEEGLKIEPENQQLKTGLREVEFSVSKGCSEGFQNKDPFAHIASKLKDPMLFSKMASNPKTISLLSDLEFMTKLRNLQENPKNIIQELSDPRMTLLLPLLLGIDLDAPNNVNGSAKSTDSSPLEDVMEVNEEPVSKSKASQEPKLETIPEMESTSVDEDEETRIKRENKEKAEKEKCLGNECYKAREFKESIQHYLAAWDLFKDISYLTNCSAAYYEDGNYEECIKCCEEAIAYGREVLADFKLISRAFGRIGSAYMKQEKYELAIKNFNCSLTEYRTPDILKKLREAEKIKNEKDRLAYIDLNKADEAREEGNRLFKQGDFSNAIKMYTEMIKRSPDDPRGYGNRAAAYIKVMSLYEALKDCDKAISLDPYFTKAYIRKASCYYTMKEFNKCIDTCHAATKADEEGNNKGLHAKEIELQLQKCMSAMHAQRENETEEETIQRIQGDPEVVAILQDPIMQSILTQARENPSALEEHMKNPQVAKKIQKLIQSGVIKVTRR